MKNVLYPLTYLGLCPFVIVLARALQSQKAFQPTYLAVTPAEAAFGSTNLPPEQLEVSLANNQPKTSDVFSTDEQYEQVYGFMQAKCGGSHAVWRERVNSLYQMIERVVLKRQITLMVLWNGNDCIGKICQMPFLN